MRQSGCVPQQGTQFATPPMRLNVAIVGTKNVPTGLGFNPGAGSVKKPE